MMATIKRPMNKRRVFKHVYWLFLMLVFFSSFLSADNNYINMKAENKDFSTGWYSQDGPVSLPYNQTDKFIITNELPEVNDYEYLLMKCRYDNVVVTVDGEKVLETSDSYYLNHVTNSGNKELIVPLKKEYSNKTISVEIDLHHSLYMTSLNVALIVSGGDYARFLMQKNIFVLCFSIIFLTTGIFELILAVTFVAKKVRLRRRYSLEAIGYAGMFSFTMSIWCITYTRLPAVLSGDMVSSSILGYICFLISPMVFLEMTRALDDHRSKLLDITVKIATTVVTAEIILNVIGIMDWAQTTLTCHILDCVCIVVALVTAYKIIRNDEQRSEKTSVVIGNAVFVTMCFTSLVIYIKDREAQFMNHFLIALMFYVISLVVYVLRHFGLNAKEARDYEVTQVYAYTDELTGLGNRRQYWNEIDKYRGKYVPDDFTVIYMDVNRLKYVNDNFGHDAGDELLLGAAQCINKVFKNAVKCRMGGDEFAIIIISPKSELDALLDRFRQTVSNWHGEKVKELNIALGVASRRELRDKKLEGLCRIADDRMYADKKAYYDECGVERRESL